MANYSRWDDIKNKRREPAPDTRTEVEHDLALGQLIYDLRTEAGLSQRELAERMGHAVGDLPSRGRRRGPEPDRHPRPCRHRTRPAPRRVVPRERPCQAQGCRAGRVTSTGTPGTVRTQLRSSGARLGDMSMTRATTVTCRRRRAR